MPTVRCPHCGSPAEVRGRRWECGWCGDFGDISSLGAAQLAELTPPPGHLLDCLEEGAFSILKGMELYYQDKERAREPAWELVTYGVSAALLHPQMRNGRNEELVRVFYREYPVCSAAAVLRAARSGCAAFDEKFCITAKRLGSFWHEALRRLPPDGSAESEPDWLEMLLGGLCRVESVFTAEEETVLRDRLQSALKAHGMR